MYTLYTHPSPIHSGYPDSFIFQVNIYTFINTENPRTEGQNCCMYKRNRRTRDLRGHQCRYGFRLDGRTSRAGMTKCTTTAKLMHHEHGCSYRMQNRCITLLVSASTHTTNLPCEHRRTTHTHTHTHTTHTHTYNTHAQTHTHTHACLVQIKDASERIDLLMREAATHGARGEFAVYQPDVEVFKKKKKKWW